MKRKRLSGQTNDEDYLIQESIAFMMAAI